MPDHTITLAREKEIKKILRFDNYEIYYLMDELNLSSSRLWALIEANNSPQDFWDEIQKNDLIADLIHSKHSSERRNYYRSRKKYLERAIGNEDYEQAAKMKRERAYFKHCFMADIPEAEID